MDLGSAHLGGRCAEKVKDTHDAWPEHVRPGFGGVGRTFALVSVLFAWFRHDIWVSGEVETVPEREGAHR